MNKLILMLVMFVVVAIANAMPVAASTNLPVNPNIFFATDCSGGANVVASGQVTHNGSGVYQAQVTLIRLSDSAVCDTVTTPPFGYYTLSPVFADGHEYLVTVNKKGCTGASQVFAAVSDITINFSLTCD